MVLICIFTYRSKCAKKAATSGIIKPTSFIFAIGIGILAINSGSGGGGDGGRVHNAHQQRAQIYGPFIRTFHKKHMFK